MRKEVLFLTKELGAMILSSAVLTVRVYMMEIPVFNATIFPNLAKGAMMQKKSGMVAMTVVMALETMATPTWRTASATLHCRQAAGSCKERQVIKTDDKMWSLYSANLTGHISYTIKLVKLLLRAFN